MNVSSSLYWYLLSVLGWTLTEMEICVALFIGECLWQQCERLRESRLERGRSGTVVWLPQRIQRIDPTLLFFPVLTDAPSLTLHALRLFLQCFHSVLILCSQIFNYHVQAWYCHWMSSMPTILWTHHVWGPYSILLCIPWTYHNPLLIVGTQQILSSEWVMFQNHIVSYWQSQ